MEARVQDISGLSVEDSGLHLQGFEGLKIWLSIERVQGARSTVSKCDGYRDWWYHFLTSVDVSL